MYKICPNLALLDRPLTDTVPLVDSVLTDPVHGQALDSVLTDIGQRLDFTSNLCPKFVCPLFSKEYRVGDGGGGGGFDISPVIST